MEQNQLKELLQVALNASEKAGRAIMKIYQEEDFGVDFKLDDSPLTKADTAAHNIIVKHLDQTGIPVLSEEGKEIPYEDRKGWDLLWIVDPIDGTKEFIKRNGEFTVNIALIQKQKPIAGVVYAPAIDTLYFSGIGLGALKFEGKEININLDSLLVNASNLPIKREDKTFTIVASRSHMSPETEDFVAEKRKEHGKVNLISKGSSLKLCMVAEGTADCYPRFAPTMEWDTSAGQAICEHAGLKVMDYKTKKNLIYNRKELLNNWFLVKN